MLSKIPTRPSCNSFPFRLLNRQKCIGSFMRSMAVYLQLNQIRFIFYFYCLFIFFWCGVEFHQKQVQLSISSKPKRQDINPIDLSNLKVNVVYSSVAKIFIMLRRFRGSFCNLAFS